MRGWVGAVAVIAVCGVAATDALEQGRNRGQIRFQEMDADNDRVITRSEWRGSDRSFQVHDWNGDGVLSGDEIRVGARPPQNRTEPRDLESPWYEQELDDWTPAHFRQLDRDGNGRITAAEWYYDRETFRRIDHNGDNWISQREFLGETEMDDDAEDVFGNLDANGDRRVSRDEWHGTRARFEALDRNNDGVLTRAEAAGTDAPADMFAAIDLNNDRQITRNEWRWSAAAFDARDANRDGRLSREEFDNVAANRSGTYRAGYDRGVAEGRQAGREDRERNQGWDLDGQRELEQADSGYDPGMGPRAEYQAGYREGFTRGYREGWGR